MNMSWLQQGEKRRRAENLVLRIAGRLGVETVGNDALRDCIETLTQPYSGPDPAAEDPVAARVVQEPPAILTPEERAASEARALRIRASEVLFEAERTAAMLRSCADRIEGS